MKTHGNGLPLKGMSKVEKDVWRSRLKWKMKMETLDGIGKRNGMTREGIRLIEKRVEKWVRDGNDLRPASGGRKSNSGSIKQAAQILDEIVNKFDHDEPFGISTVAKKLFGVSALSSGAYISIFDHYGGIHIRKGKARRRLDKERAKATLLKLWKVANKE